MRIARRVVEVLLAAIILFIVYGLLRLKTFGQDDMVEWAELNLWIQKAYAGAFILAFIRSRLKKPSAKTADQPSQE